MTFNTDQLAALSKYEGYFRTAVNSNWARNPGREAVEEIHGILSAATGDRRSSNSNCQACILGLLRDTGRLYYADKAEAESRRSVKASAVPAKTRKKVTLKTEAE